MESKQESDILQLEYAENGELITSLIASLAGLGIFILSFVPPFANNKIDLPLALVGILFLICGILLALGANKRTTFLHKTQPCQVITKRILTGKEIQKTFIIADIKQIDYLKGYEGSWRFSHAGSEINLIMKNGERIRLMKRWANKYFNLGVNTSLSNEASVIAQFLGVPLNTIDVTTFVKGVQNIGAALESTAHQDHAEVILQNTKTGGDTNSEIRTS